MSRLRDHGRSQQLDGILGLAGEMLAPKAKDRLHMWEAEMNLQEVLKTYDDLIPNLEEDLCVSPPYDTDPLYSKIMLNFSRPSVEQYAETPLHRAAKKGNRHRVIRL